MSGAGGEKQPPLGVYKCKETVHDFFLQSGQKDLLMAHIRQKTTQDGWTWTMRDELISYIKKRGPNNINVSHMVADLAPLARELFPSDLKKELVESMFEVTKDYFTIDDTSTPITDPDNPDSEAEKTFLYQSRDTKPDPGLGIGVEVEDSPPPSPQGCSPSAASTPRQSPGPATSSVGSTPRQSPVQNTSRQSPGVAPRQSPVSTAPRPLTPQSLPPPPVLRAETTSAKAEPIVSRNSSQDEAEEDDDDEDARNNEEDEEDELMDV